METTTLYRVNRTIWYIFYVIETLLGIRFILRLLGANPAAGFTDIIYTLSGIFAAPFRFVFETPAIGQAAIEFSTLLAMIVYWLLAWGIIKLIAMNRQIDVVEADQTLEEQDKA